MLKVQQFLKTHWTFSVRRWLMLGIWIGLSFIFPFIPGIYRDQYGHFVHYQSVLVPYALLLWNILKILLPELEGGLREELANYWKSWRGKIQ